MNILLVEDDVFQATMAEVMFAQFEDVHLDTKYNGTEAIRHVQDIQSDIDMMICDLSMPDVDGLELLRHLAQISPDIPIAILSSADEHVMNSALQMAKSYGLTDIEIVAKPLTPTHARHLVEKILLKDQSVIHYPKAVDRFTPTVQDIEMAFANNEFVVHYQPKVSSKSFTVESVEALIRWQHPTMGTLSPFFFLETLIDAGFGRRLTRWILERSVKDCIKWQAFGLTLDVSVNVTPSDIADLNFAEYVIELLKIHRLSPERLMIEVTENEVSPNQGHMLETLSRLRLAHVGVSIDDFGTGFSSFSQFLNAPFNELKIDRSFVEFILTNTKHQKAVRAMLVLARELNIKTVVEGVETQEQLALLMRIGCDSVQGYVFSKPKPFNDLFSWAVEQNMSLSA